METQALQSDSAVSDASKSSPNRARFSVDLPSAIDAQLEEMAAEKGVTKTEMIRIAVRAMANIHELDKDGYRNASIKVMDDGTREAVRILF